MGLVQVLIIQCLANYYILYPRHRVLDFMAEAYWPCTINKRVSIFEGHGRGLHGLGQVAGWDTNQHRAVQHQQLREIILYLNVEALQLNCIVKIASPQDSYPDHQTKSVSLRPRGWSLTPVLLFLHVTSVGHNSNNVHLCCFTVINVFRRHQPSAARALRRRNTAGRIDIWGIIWDASTSKII